MIPLERLERFYAILERDEAERVGRCEEQRPHAISDSLLFSASAPGASSTLVFDNKHFRQERVRINTNQWGYEKRFKR